VKKGKDLSRAPEFLVTPLVTFNSSFDTGCLKFKFLDNSCFSQLFNFVRKSCNLEQMKKYCISQGNAVTFFRCDGQMYKNRCQMFSVFRILKIILKSVYFGLSDTKK